MTSKRFTALPIPGREDEAATWYVFDRLTRSTVMRADDMRHANELALELNDPISR